MDANQGGKNAKDNLVDATQTIDELDVDLTQNETKPKQAIQFRSTREKRLPITPKQPVTGTKKRTLDSNKAKGEPADVIKKTKHADLFDSLGPSTIGTSKVPPINEDDVEEVVPPSETSLQRRPVCSPMKRSSLPPLAVTLVENARRLRVPVREYLTSGRAFEDYTNEKKREKIPIADKACGKAEQLSIGPGQAITSGRIVVPAAPIEKGVSDPPPISSKASSPANRGTPKARSTTPTIQSTKTPESSPGHSSAASSALSTPKLTSSPKPVVLDNVTGRVTFASSSDYARYTHDVAVLETAEQRKRERRRQRGRRRQNEKAEVAAEILAVTS